MKLRDLDTTAELHAQIIDGSYERTASAASGWARVKANSEPAKWAVKSGVDTTGNKKPRKRRNPARG